MASNPAEILAQGQALVPNAGEQMLREQMGRLQLQGAQLQNQAQAQALKQAQTQFQRQQSFGHDMETFTANPTPQGLASLFGRYPEFAKPIQDAHGALDEGRRKTDMTQIGSVAAMASRGDFKGAGDLMESRIAADKAAGQDTASDEAILQHFRSSDPAQQKIGVAMAAIGLGGAVGPEQAAAFLKANGLSDEPFTLSQGQVRYGSDGKPIASVAPKPDYLIIPEGGKAVPVGPGGPQGTIQGNPSAPAGGGGQVSTGGMSPKVAAVSSTLASGGLPAPVVAGFMGNFHVEGGYDGAQGDGGSSSGIMQLHSPDRISNFERVIGKPVTQAGPEDQAKFVLWEMQNPQAAGMTVAQRDAILAAKTPAQAAALIDQYYERSSGKDRKTRMSAATAFAGDSAPAQAASGSQPGDPAGTLYGNPKPGYTLLTPQQVQAQGLNPAKTWQKGPDGQTTAVGDAPTTAVPGDPNLTGPAYLESLKNPGLANRLRGIASGMLPYPPQGRTANQTILNALSQFEPTLDANAYNQRKAAVQAFTGNGKAAQTVGSANRLAAHLGDLLDASSHLSGPDLKWGPLSSVVASGMQSFERANAVKYDQAAAFVADEAEKIARNSPGTAHGIEITLKNLSRANSLETRNAAIKELASLVHGAIEPLQSQYESAFQGAAVRPKVPWISPTARAIYSHAGVDFGDVSIGDGGGSAAPATGAVHTSLPPGAHPLLKADGTPATSGGKPVYEWTGRDGKVHRAVPQ